MICIVDQITEPCAQALGKLGIHDSLDLLHVAFSDAYQKEITPSRVSSVCADGRCEIVEFPPVEVWVYPNISLLQLLGKIDRDSVPANNKPQQPQQPKSPARQQCEANAGNKYQNTFNAVDSSFYRDAYKSGLKGVLWGGLVGCALTSEIGCAEGGLPLAVIGGLAGAGKSMWENLGSVGMAYLQYRDEMNACKAIP